MNDTEQRIAIAEACGWKYCGAFLGQDKTNVGIPKGWKPNSTRAGYVTVLPDYLNDLNAMHEAAMWLRENHPLEYVHYTAAITALVAKFNSDLENRYSISAHDATARQRADAFVQTLAKWKDKTQ